MTEIDAREKLLSEIKSRVSSFHSSVAWYRRKHYITSMMTVILSATITVLSGWGSVDKINTINFSQLVLILGALITVVSAWGAFFSPRESWHLYANTLNNLRALQTEIEFESSMEKSTMHNVDKLRSFFSRYQRILKEHNDAWVEIRKSQPLSPGKRQHLIAEEVGSD